MLIGLIIGIYWVGFFGFFVPIARRRDRAFKREYPSLYTDQNYRLGSVAFETIILSFIWPLLAFAPVGWGLRALMKIILDGRSEKQKSVRAS